MPAMAGLLEERRFAVDLPILRSARREARVSSQCAWLSFQQYCRLLCEALGADDDGDHPIDMDAVAEAVGMIARSLPSTMQRRASRISSHAAPAVSSTIFLASLPIAQFAAYESYEMAGDRGLGVLSFNFNWEQVQKSMETHRKACEHRSDLVPKVPNELQGPHAALLLHARFLHREHRGNGFESYPRTSPEISNNLQDIA